MSGPMIPLPTSAAAATNGLPSGGTAGQVLTKNSGTNYDAGWATPTGGGSSDHGTLTGLADDDHAQYHNDARGDARYSQLGHTHAAADVGAYTIGQTDTLLEGRAEKSGFPVDASGNYLVDITYNETTRTITVTPSGANFDVYVQGQKFNFTGAQTKVHAATQGGHFIYVDSAGVIQTSTTPWNLDQTAPIAFVFWDATNSRGVPFYEWHHAGRDVFLHKRMHDVDGTQIVSGFSMTGHTLSDGSSDAAVTFAIGSGVIADEDIEVTTSALADGGPYWILERAGASGDWQVSRSSVLPFLYSGNILQYNQNTGATWQRTNLTEDYYVNYWVFGVTALPASKISPVPSSTPQVVIVAGQAIHSSQTAATAETLGSLSFGTLPFQEIAPLYQVTLRYNSSAPSAYTNTARCAIVAVTRIVGTKAIITQAAATDHGALSGLSDDDHSIYPFITGGSRPIFNLSSIAKGVIGVFDGTNIIALAPGTDGYVLTTDSSTASGLKWAASSGGSGGKTVLTADTTYYVATTGNDTTGTGAVGAPWLTIQKAINWIIANIDAASYQVTIQVADGTYNISTGITTRDHTFQKAPIIQGNIGTPANVLISNTSANSSEGCFWNNGQWLYKGLHLKATSCYCLIYAGNARSIAQASNMIFEDGNNQLVALLGGHIEAYTAITWKGTVGGVSNLCFWNGIIYLSGTHTFSTYTTTDFINAKTNSMVVLWPTFTWSGTFTGKRYNIAGNSVVDTNGQATTWIPGSIAGTTATGAQYI